MHTILKSIIYHFDKINKMYSVSLIQQNIEELAQVLKQYTPLINAHMVDYFKNNSYEHCLPFEIRNEIENMGYENAIEQVFCYNNKGNISYLNNFIKKTKDCSLYNRKDVCLSIKDLQEKLIKSGCSNVSGIQLKVFMKPKKSHEVEVLSAIVASLKTIENVTHLVDIGDGKGYLSSLLSLHYKIPVLGIDASAINTTGAVKRVQKLGRFWPGIINTSKSMLPMSERDLSVTNVLYKQVTQFVTEETNFRELLVNVFLEEISGIGIVGLHTCGNLAPVTLKTFASNEDIRILCNVSCCYHLLSEKDDEHEEKESYSFPMSNYLKNKNYYLGRIARMLSAQSTDRILNKKELPNKNIFYRAVLEMLLNEYFPNNDSRSIGKLKSVLPFPTYTRKALQKLNLNLDIIDDEEISKFYNHFIHREKELYTFNLLRCMMAPLIESLILLDRLLYLHELGFTNSYLVQLFDPVISPRCYGIVSFKNA